MLKPFYQGKLDTFCAIYAVLNALRLTHGIRTTRARDILNETLMALAGNPEALRAVLTQETDYLQLVDGILRAQKHKFPLEVQAPWDEQAQPDENEFWTACRRWLDGGTKRAIIFRFLRHMTPDGPAVNRHWTVADRINDSVITELAFLDTIAPIDSSLCSKIKYLTVAPMFAEAIERIYQEISVSKLFL